MGELGIRYKCYECETKFYDLNRPQPLCPSCGKDQNEKKVDKPYKRKKWRSSFKTEPQIEAPPEDSDALIDPEDSDHSHGKGKDEDGYALGEEEAAAEEDSEEEHEEEEESVREDE